MDYIDYVVKILEKHPIPIAFLALGFIVEKYLESQE